MDNIANSTEKQQTQITSHESQNKGPKINQQVAQTQKADIAQDEIAGNKQKIGSKEQVKDLIDQLNKAISPMNTTLKFGVDSQDVFYVSVIDSETNKMIRRFPAEQAADFLPKMKEVTGILFDYKG